MKKLNRLYILFIVFAVADVVWIASAWAYFANR